MTKEVKLLWADIYRMHVRVYKLTACKFNKLTNTTEITTRFEKPDRIKRSLISISNCFAQSYVLMKSIDYFWTDQTKIRLHYNSHFKWYFQMSTIPEIFIRRYINSSLPNKSTVKKVNHPTRVKSCIVFFPIISLIIFPPVFVFVERESPLRHLVDYSDNIEKVARLFLSHHQIHTSDT